MGFISATASKAVAGGSGTGGYLSVSKLVDGESVRVAIVSENPLEMYEVWGEDDNGTKKPFRFSSEPSAANIIAELGDFKQRQNYEGTALEAPKFVIAFFAYDFSDSKVKVFSISQKTVIKELDKLSQDDDYANFAEWDFKFSRSGLRMSTEYSVLPSPRKKGTQEEIDAAWSAAQEAGYDLNQLLIGGSPFGS